MKRVSIHVVPHDQGWARIREGAGRATSVHRTQREAIERARDQARRERAEIVIHRRNGSIRERDSHGHDPFPPKG